jgi:hypothetical protein
VKGELAEANAEKDADVFRGDAALGQANAALEKERAMRRRTLVDSRKKVQEMRQAASAADSALSSARKEAAVAVSEAQARAGAAQQMLADAEAREAHLKSSLVRAQEEAAANADQARAAQDKISELRRAAEREAMARERAIRSAEAARLPPPDELTRTDALESAATAAKAALSSARKEAAVAVSEAQARAGAAQQMLADAEAREAHLKSSLVRAQEEAAANAARAQAAQAEISVLRRRAAERVQRETVVRADSAPLSTMNDGQSITRVDVSSAAADMSSLLAGEGPQGPTPPPREVPSKSRATGAVPLRMIVRKLTSNISPVELLHEFPLALEVEALYEKSTGALRHTVLTFDAKRPPAIKRSAVLGCELQPVVNRPLVSSEMRRVLWRAEQRGAKRSVVKVTAQKVAAKVSPGSLQP